MSFATFFDPADSARFGGLRIGLLGHPSRKHCCWWRESPSCPSQSTSDEVVHRSESRPPIFLFRNTKKGIFIGVILSFLSRPSGKHSVAGGGKDLHHAHYPSLSNYSRGVLHTSQSRSTAPFVLPVWVAAQRHYCCTRASKFSGSVVLAILDLNFLPLVRWW